MEEKSDNTTNLLTYRSSALVKEQFQEEEAVEKQEEPEKAPIPEKVQRKQTQLFALPPIPKAPPNGYLIQKPPPPVMPKFSTNLNPEDQGNQTGNKKSQENQQKFQAQEKGTQRIKYAPPNRRGGECDCLECDNCVVRIWCFFVMVGWIPICIPIPCCYPKR